MSKLVCALLLTCMGAASTQLAQARSEWQPVRSQLQQGVGATPTLNPTPVPTVLVPQSTPIPVPTLSVPKPKHKHARVQRTRAASPSMLWMWAFLTSYCPGSAGWLASSGRSVFYGMLANDFYPFGTRVYMPVLGMTGVVEDRFGGGTSYDHFDVWSPVCYGTPTGWFKVALVK